MIFVDYIGRTGNRLFQFSFGKIISILSGAELVAEEIFGFPNTKGYIKTRNINSDKFSIFDRSASNLTTEQINKIVEIAKIKDVYLRNYFQNIDYYEPYKTQLKEFLCVEEGEYIQTSDNDIVVHIRLGDYFIEYINNTFIYDLYFIFNLIKIIKYDRCIIVTDEPKSGRLDIFKELPNCIISGGDYLFDYRTFNNAKRIIMTPSSFSWWGAWTGNANEIYFPNYGYWKINNLNLNLINKNIISYP